LFDHRLAKLVVVRIREGGDFVKRDGGVERPPNTLPKTSSDARCSAGVLVEDRPVVGRDRVGASTARPGIATSARPSGLGAGAVA
jgi:hypothetical protein